MKTIVALFFLVLAIPTQAIQFFNGTYEEARQKAKAENKNLFISFTASWCGPCRMMKKIVYDNPKVTQYIEQHYIPLSLNIDFPENLLLQQRVSSQHAGAIPHICIITPDEEVIKENSSVTCHQMMKFLKVEPDEKPVRKLAAAEGIVSLNTNKGLFPNRTRYSEVLEQARRENKNMLLCFSSHFCGPCRYMHETTFQNPEIIRKVNEQFVTGYFETGDLLDRSLCYRYNNKEIAIPYLVIATPDEKIIRKYTGYMDTTAFTTFIISSQDTVYENIPTQMVTFSEGTPSILSRFFYNQSHYKWKLRITAAANTTILKTSGSLSDIDFNYRAGYEFGFSVAYERPHLAITPALSFISKGGKNKDITLRQNYLELPVKLSWIYQNSYQGHWKGISISPYGSFRIGEKLENNTDDYPDAVFKTQRFDYGLRFATNMRMSSFDFEAGYILGLHNISDYQNGKMYNRGFFLNMSLCF